ncbi:MAG: lactate utilization protein [Oscillospiraceae bacterium]
MADPKKMYYDKRGEIMVKNLTNHGFEAYYCENKEAALAKALELIPKGATVGWGGAMSAQQIGLLDAMNDGEYNAIDRDKAPNPEEREKAMRACLQADYFITGANAMSIDGQMVNIDGVGNRVAAIVYGPKYVVVIAGMNKVTDSLEAAVTRARTVAAPMNKQRFPLQTPCAVTGVCGNCKTGGICNQLLITRNSKPIGRIKVILVGEELGL